MTEDEMVGWHHQHNGHEFGWTPGVGDGQGGLVCRGCKQLDMTERLNCTERRHPFSIHFPVTMSFIHLHLWDVWVWL